MRIITRNSKWFNSSTLTKKALLNAIVSLIDYFIRIIVSFLITPIIVHGLGDLIFGTWQTLNRVIGFLSPAIAQQTQTLRWIIARQQSSTDFDNKRRNVGSALVTLIIFVPFFIFCGVLLTWYIPIWLNIPANYLIPIRITIILLLINLIISNFNTLPKSVLEGENLGYKQIGFAASISILGGIFTWVILFLEQGVVGIAAIGLLMSLLTGFYFFYLAKTNISWFGVEKPSKDEVRKFFNISIWFLIADIIKKIMALSDVVIVAFLLSVESVTSFTLTKYAPEIMLSFITIVIVGIIPGYGGVLGSGKIEKASALRNELFSISWLTLTVFSVVILIWNQVFLNLWVGVNQFSGTIENLLIVLVSFQHALIKIDSIIIDLTLKIHKKVVLGLISVSISIIGSVILIKYLNLGIIGLCIGLIIGRLLISISYPLMVGDLIFSPFVKQLKKIVRPGVVTVILFGITMLVNSFKIYKYFSGISGWLLFFAFTIASSILIFFVSFFSGLSKNQRKVIIARFRLAVLKISDI